ncbi:hypothetical protein KSX_89420 [Ktedonospora formicarum]|uniref:Peptidoglycan binding-like domain-containing protein n=2 Tax=Ktedonospora formicarum TaxID=2778364 RepID=A0A8J3IF47_9CHLR|nr:hypothetical protein KSX_89420 [Ktedonospora formicarum]
MQKAVKMMLCGALLLAALFSFSAFASAHSAHASTLSMNPHATSEETTTHAVPNTTMSPSYSCPLPVIAWGQKNPSSAVKLAQQSLNYWYNTPSSGFKKWVKENSNGDPFPLAVDGQFGVLTQQAVFDFQDYYGLDSDGIVGRQTWHALGHC